MAEETKTTEIKGIWKTIAIIIVSVIAVLCISGIFIPEARTYIDITVNTLLKFVPFIANR